MPLDPGRFARPCGPMERKDGMDAFGAVALSLFAIFLAFNQVVIKVLNDGFQPVFGAGFRSFGAVFCLWLWLRLRGIPLDLGGSRVAFWGVISGSLFALEFLCLFVALDLTTVSRSSVIFYSMPVWMALMAHLFSPGDRLTPQKSAGLALAMAGVGLAMVGRGEGQGSLLGDLAALGAAVLWAATGLITKVSPLQTLRPEVQLFWHVAISAPLLLLAAPFFGPVLRDPGWLEISAMAWQIAVVVTAGFVFWLWLLSIYPASGVASFSFLSPVFGVVFGWALMGDRVGPSLILALVLVALGLVLINAAPVRFRRRSG